MSSSTQRLQQGVCQKYGWGIEYGECSSSSSSTEYHGEYQESTTTTKIETEEVCGCWCVKIYWRMGTSCHYVVRKSVPGLRRATCTKKEWNAAKAAVSAVALRELQPRIQQEEAKPVITLQALFPTPIRIYDSAVFDWDEKIFSSTTKPTIVGIDVEGNQISPPVLIQISTEQYTILEVPIVDRMTGIRSISANLQRLLQDDTITKIFCDNFSHNDKKCLGLVSSVDQEEDADSIVKHDDDFCGRSTMVYTHPPIIDLEVCVLQSLGPAKVARGLSKLVQLCNLRPPSSSNLSTNTNTTTTNASYRIEKPKKSTKGRFQNIGIYSLIEQGK